MFYMCAATLGWLKQLKQVSAEPSPDLVWRSATIFVARLE